MLNRLTFQSSFDKIRQMSATLASVNLWAERAIIPTDQKAGYADHSKLVYLSETISDWDI